MIRRKKAVIYPNGTISYPEETEGETVPGGTALTESEETDDSEDELVRRGGAGNYKTNWLIFL